MYLLIRFSSLRNCKIENHARVHTRCLATRTADNNLFDTRQKHFASCNPYDMLYVIHEALDTYKNKEEWQALMKKAATTDFSWSRSAEEYKKLYEETLKV